MTDSTLFAGVDHALLVSGFADQLRAAGLPVTLPANERAAASLGVIGSPTVPEMYWLLRVSLLSDVTQLTTFERVFDRVFQTDSSLLRAKADQRSGATQAADGDTLVALRAAGAGADETSGLPWATRPAVDASRDDPNDSESPTTIDDLGPSAEAIDPDRPFHTLDENEVARYCLALEDSFANWPHRRSRRRRLTRHGGPVALRPSLRAAMRTGGEVFDLWHTETTERPRSVVALVDVSGSMESHARVALHLTRPLALVHQAEVFAFATRLTRVTPAVRLHSPDEAISRASEQVTDRFSGTRLATSIDALLRHSAWSTCVRGAVVLIVSDGWDTDPPERLARAMRRLHGHAHRVVWVNPRLSADDFVPSTGGMAAARPFCDDFLPGDTPRAMDDVIAALTVSASRDRPARARASA